MQLRDYQEEARGAVQQEWQSGRKRTLLVLPTGCGKTIVFSKIIEDRVRMGERVLVLAHRSELLEQASDKLMTATGLSTALEKAESTSIGSWFRVVVGSVQTLQREKRLSQFPPNYFDTIIIDEAHHAISDGYQRVLQHFDDSNVLGVTATPDRGDRPDTEFCIGP
jgi:superfamily II DNA or RNA helicase